MVCGTSKEFTSHNQMLITIQTVAFLRFRFLVMDDPDQLELEEADRIGIFEPGSYFEREVDWDHMSKFLLMVGGAFGLMIALSIVIMIPLLATGHIILDLDNNTFWISSVGQIILATAEIGLVIPPLWYIKNNGFPLRSIGIRNY